MGDKSADNELTDYKLERIICVPQLAPPRRRDYWHIPGGGSLAVSVMVHGAFVIIALLVIWRTATPEQEVPYKITTGGRSGGGHSEKALRKQHAISHAQPAKKLVSPNGATYRLPNTAAVVSIVPALAASMLSGGSPGS